MALESSRVRADVVEVQEFPQLAQAYRVMSVPKTVINDKVQFIGAVPEEELLKRVLQAVGVEQEAAGGGGISGQTSPVG